MAFPANVPANTSPANTNLKATEGWALGQPTGPETGHPCQTSGISPTLAALRSFLAQVEELIPHKCLSPNDPLAKDAAGQLPTLKRSLLLLSCPAEEQTAREILSISATGMEEALVLCVSHHGRSVTRPGGNCWPLACRLLGVDG